MAGQQTSQQMLGRNLTDALGSTNITFALMEGVVWNVWCKMDFNSYPLDKQVTVVCIK